MTRRITTLCAILCLLLSACESESTADVGVDAGPPPVTDTSTDATTGGDTASETPGDAPIPDPEPDVETSPEPDVAAEPDVVCTPDCAGKECGDDGCGGSCGDCGFVSGVSLCISGMCTIDQPCPQCQVWNGGSCVPDGIDATVDGGLWCGTDAIIGCVDGEVTVISGCAGCGCDDTGPPMCMSGVPSCNYCGCDDKECGPGDCGEWCGDCAEGSECNGTNQCVCVPNCGGAECSDDGCGGSCGDCADGSSCQVGECVAEPSPGEFGAACEVHEDCVSGWCVEGLDSDVCTQVCIDACPDGWVCQVGGSATDIVYLCLPEQDACVGDCTDTACGDDGCGQSCGSCGVDESCEAGACVCVPSCGDAVCGDDGCGGACGDCAAGELCEAGVCAAEVCTPFLSYCASPTEVVACNAVGTGPEPGTASDCADSAGNPNFYCADGACTCDATCDAGVVCGDDGCGGSCGACADGANCEAGLCVAASLCPPGGPFGTGVGDTLGDWSLTDCDGVEHSFHDLCELRAVHIFAFAGW
jgi:hypothetical protein